MGDTIKKAILLDKAILGLHRFTDAECSRFNGALGCVRVTPTHGEATNGYLLIRVPVTATDPAEFPSGGETFAPLDSSVLIPAETVKATEKAIPKPSRNGTLPIVQFALLAVNGTASSLTVTDLESRNQIGFKPGEGAYPETERVIPSAQAPAAVTLDAVLLRDVLDYVIKARGYKGAVPVAFRIRTADDAVRLDFHVEGDRRALAVIMPMKGAELAAGE